MHLWDFVSHAWTFTSILGIHVFLISLSTLFMNIIISIFLVLLYIHLKILILHHSNWLVNTSLLLNKGPTLHNVSNYNFIDCIFNSPWYSLMGGVHFYISWSFKFLISLTCQNSLRNNKSLNILMWIILTTLSATQLILICLAWLPLELFHYSFSIFSY